MSRPRAARTTAVAAACTAVLAACGGGSGAGGSSSSSGSASPSATSLSADLVAVSQRLITENDDVVVRTDSDGLRSTTVHHGDATSLDSTSDYGHLQAIRIGDDVWVRDDNPDDWRRDLESPSAPAAAAGVDPASLVGRWVLATGTRVGRSSIPGDPPLFPHPDDTTVVGHATVHGVDTVEYSDPIALQKVYLTTGANPVPVKVESTASSTTTISEYSKIGAAPAVVAPDPSTVVDGTEFLSL